MSALRESSSSGNLRAFSVCRDSAGGTKDATGSRPEAAKVTLPLNPPEGVTVIVLEPLAPCAMLKLAGLADRVKLGLLTVPIVRAMVVVCVNKPLVPVIVMGKVPAAALPWVTNVSTVPVVTGFAPNVAVTPVGTPDNDTFP